MRNEIECETFDQFKEYTISEAIQVLIHAYAKGADIVSFSTELTGYHSPNLQVRFFKNEQENK